MSLELPLTRMAGTVAFGCGFGSFEGDFQGVVYVVNLSRHEETGGGSLAVLLDSKRGRV
jgi:hypothetical protein